MLGNEETCVCTLEGEISRCCTRNCMLQAIDKYYYSMEISSVCELLFLNDTLIALIVIILSFLFVNIKVVKCKIKIMFHIDGSATYILCFFSFCLCLVRNKVSSIKHNESAKDTMVHMTRLLLEGKCRTH